MKTKHIIPIVLALTLTACQESSQFLVSGTIAGAENKTVYLEHTTLTQIMPMDSCVLGENGAFSLHASSPQYPDFYRLRVVNRSLPLAVDSTETITVTTTLDSLPYTVCIEGSGASLAMAKLRATARTATRDELRQHAQQTILKDPRSLAAYYAVFFKQGGEYIWNMYDPADRRMFQAVATSFNTWMPEYERSKTLYVQVSSALKAERELQQQVAIRQFIDNAESSLLDISLPDEEGLTRSLSDLSGKVVVLDFSAIEMEQSQGYIFELRELYNRYRSRGLTIYSVSLDRNRLLWEDGVVNLPWINVYAGDQATEVLLRYNVQSLPTLFLLDRKGNVQGRYSNFEQLDADIRKYL